MEQPAEEERALKIQSAAVRSDRFSARTMNTISHIEVQGMEIRI
jgi:hypothetical protein